MAKWNPFDKNVLKPDPDEFAGSEDAGYGVPHDADAYQESASHDVDQDQASHDMDQDVIPHDVDQDVAPGDAAVLNGNPFRAEDGIMLNGTPFTGEDEGIQNGKSFTTDDTAVPGTNPSATDPSAAGQGHAPVSDPENVPSAGTVSTSPADTVSTAPAGTVSTAPVGTSSTAPAGTGSASPAGTVSASPAGTGSIPPAGTGSVPPAGPGNTPPKHPGSGKKHDFEVDEPKFDTQTGERLDRPKKKLPAILLSFAVTALTVCAFFYSVKPGALPSRKEDDRTERTESETEAHRSAVSSGAETEAAHPAPVQTEQGPQTEEAQSESGVQTEQAIQAMPLTDAEQTESKAQTKAEPESKAETETETETENKLWTVGTTGDRSRLPEDGSIVIPPIEMPNLVNEAEPDKGSADEIRFWSIRDFYKDRQLRKYTDTGEKAGSGKTQKKEQEKEKEQKETISLALAYPETETSSDQENPSGDTEKETPKGETLTKPQTETEENRIETEEPLTEAEDETEEILSAPGTEESGQSKDGTEAPQGQLGVQVGEFSKEDQIIYRIPAGAVLAHVSEGSGAQAAGLVPGDLITGINDERVESVDQLKEALSGLKAGDKVKVTFIRPDEDSKYKEKNEMSVTVTLQ